MTTWNFKKKLYFIPLWKKHTNREYLNPHLSIIIQILPGIVTTLLLLNYPVFSIFNFIIDRIDTIPPLPLQIFFVPLFQIVVPFILGVFCLIFSYRKLYNTLELKMMKTSFTNYFLLYREARLDFLIDFILGFFLGVFSGIMFALILAFPYYILCIFFILFFFPVFNSVIFAFFSSILLCQIVIIFGILYTRVKVHTQDKQKEIKQQSYPISARDEQILKSNLIPVVCNSCKSLISGELEICPICFESIIESQT